MADKQRRSACDAMAEVQVVREMHGNYEVLSAKPRLLSAEQIAEVENFVELLRSRRQEKELVHPAAALTEATFHAAWSNEEDDIHDGI